MENSYFSVSESFPLFRLDSLDHILNAQYNHSDDLFLPKEGVYVQREPIWTVEQKPCGRFFASLRPENEEPPKEEKDPPRKIVIGGIKAKASPHSVKLINVGQHTPLTNPGYSRQTSDGNVFNY